MKTVHEHELRSKGLSPFKSIARLAFNLNGLRIPPSAFSLAGFLFELAGQMSLSLSSRAYFGLLFCPG